MSGRSKITRLIPFAIVVSTGLGLLAWKYFANQPQGDVTVTDKGIFGYYPRYEVRFPNISLKSTGTHTFVCKGLPHEKLRFYFEMPDLRSKEQEVAEFLQHHPDSVYVGSFDEKKHKAIERNGTVVEFTLVADGQVILNRAAGPLRDWKIDWLGGTDTSTYFFGGPLAIRPETTYRLTIVVKEVDPDGMPSELLPVLNGGGWSLTPLD